MLKYILLFIILVSCSPIKRANWHYKKAISLNKELIKDSISYIDTVIYREIKVFIPEGKDTIIKDSIITERTDVIVFKYNDTCYAKLKEKSFKHNWIDTFNWKDTCYTKIVNEQNLSKPTNKVYYYIVVFLVGLIIGLYIKN